MARIPLIWLAPHGETRQVRELGRKRSGELLGDQVDALTEP